MAETGFVYFLRSECGKYTKIGSTKKLTPRARLLGILVPFKTRLAFAFHCTEFRDWERHYHDVFKDKRINGEWFSLSESDIQEVRRGLGIYTKRERRHFAFIEAEEERLRPQTKLPHEYTMLEVEQLLQRKAVSA